MRVCNPLSCPIFVLGHRGKCSGSVAGVAVLVEAGLSRIRIVCMVVVWRCVGSGFETVEF